MFQNGIEFSIKFFTPLEPCKPNGQEGDLWVICIRTKYALDVLLSQPIKLVQVASTLELLEKQWNEKFSPK